MQTKHVFIDNLTIEKFNFHKKLKHVTCGKEAFNIASYLSIPVGFFLNSETDQVINLHGNQLFLCYKGKVTPSCKKFISTWEPVSPCL